MTNVIFKVQHMNLDTPKSEAQIQCMFITLYTLSFFLNANFVISKINLS